MECAIRAGRLTSIEERYSSAQGQPPRVTHNRSGLGWRLTAFRNESDRQCIISHDRPRPTVGTCGLLPNGLRRRHHRGASWFPLELTSSKTRFLRRNITRLSTQYMLLMSRLQWTVTVDGVMFGHSCENACLRLY